MDRFFLPISRNMTKEKKALITFPPTRISSMNFKMYSLSPYVLLIQNESKRFKLICETNTLFYTRTITYTHVSISKSISNLNRQFERNSSSITIYFHNLLYNILTQKKGKKEEKLKSKVYCPK